MQGKHIFFCGEVACERVDDDDGGGSPTLAEEGSVSKPEGARPLRLLAVATRAWPAELKDGGGCEMTANPFFAAGSTAARHAGAVGFEQRKERL